MLLSRIPLEEALSIWKEYFDKCSSQCQHLAKILLDPSSCFFVPRFSPASMCDCLSGPTAVLLLWGMALRKLYTGKASNTWGFIAHWVGSWPMINGTRAWKPSFLASNHQLWGVISMPLDRGKFRTSPKAVPLLGFFLFCILRPSLFFQFLLETPSINHLCSNPHFSICF